MPDASGALARVGSREKKNGWRLGYDDIRHKPGRARTPYRSRQPHFKIRLAVVRNPFHAWRFLLHRSTVTESVLSLNSK